MKKKNNLQLIIIGIMLAAIILAAGFFIFKDTIFQKFNISLPSSSKNYQSVFLTNNQVYFGKLSNEDSAYPILHDVYYLKKVTDSAGNSKLELVKRGKELHAPEDGMKINKQNILMIENLTEDSAVYKAIVKAQNLKPEEMDKISAETSQSENALPPSEMATPSANVQGASTSATAPAVGSRLVKIKDSEVGFLRVRAKPDAASAEVGRVSPGLYFKVVAEENGWVQIEFKVGQKGWVSSQYVSVE